MHTDTQSTSDACMQTHIRTRTRPITGACGTPTCGPFRHPGRELVCVVAPQLLQCFAVLSVQGVHGCSEVRAAGVPLPLGDLHAHTHTWCALQCVRKVMLYMHCAGVCCTCTAAVCACMCVKFSQLLRACVYLCACSHWCVLRVHSCSKKDWAAPEPLAMWSPEGPLPALHFLLCVCKHDSVHVCMHCPQTCSA